MKAMIDNNAARPLVAPSLVSLLVLLSTVLAAQGVVVTGTVKKAANEPVAGAEVTFINEDDPFDAFNDVTDIEGGYRIDFRRATAIAGERDGTPSSFQLHQNYPNPFNPSTVITYHIPAAGRTRIEVYNSLGQRVQTLTDAWQEAGFHTITWDGLDDSGRGQAAGVYIYKLTSGSLGESRKMVLSDGAITRSSVGQLQAKPSSCKTCRPSESASRGREWSPSKSTAACFKKIR
jgi:hypothetical protein